MKLSTSVVIVVSLVNLCHSLKLPSDFKKCDKNNNDFDGCLSHAILDAVKHLDKPKSEYGLPGLGPLVLPTNIEIGNSTGGLRQIYSNIKLDLTKISDAKAKMDFGSNTLNLDLFFSELKIEIDYHAFGSLLILPFNSSGKLYGVHTKPVFKFVFNLDKYVKDNNHHYKVVKTHVDLLTEHLGLEYKDVFQSKVLNDAFNAELGANWRKIIDYLWNKYSGVFAQLFGGIFENLLRRVPINELFDGVKV